MNLPLFLSVVWKFLLDLCVFEKLENLEYDYMLKQFNNNHNNNNNNTRLKNNLNIRVE